MYVGFAIHTHTHPYNGPFPGLPRLAGTRKVKPIWIVQKQETVSGSGISWAICKSALRSRQIATCTPPLSFLHAGCPSCRPTNTVKALKAIYSIYHSQNSFCTSSLTYLFKLSVLNCSNCSKSFCGFTHNVQSSSCCRHLCIRLCLHIWNSKWNFTHCLL